MRNAPRTPSQLTFLAAGLAGTATAVFMAIMASLLPSHSHTYAVGRERTAPVVLPTVQIVAQRN